MTYRQEWARLDHHFRTQTWEQHVFALLSIPLGAAAGLLALTGKAATPWRIALASIACACAGAVIFADLGIGIALAVAVVAIASQVVPSLVAAASFWCVMEGSKVASMLPVTRPILFVLILPVQLAGYAAVASIHARTGDERFRRGMRLAAIEAYPLTHHWWDARTDAMRRPLLDAIEMLREYVPGTDVERLIR